MTTIELNIKVHIAVITCLFLYRQILFNLTEEEVDVGGNYYFKSKFKHFETFLLYNLHNILVFVNILNSFNFYKDK